ncbi:MAG: hypothetical protein IJ470_03405, partial [Clostridia bacterium]|nr:hypothetical protein [Clostridia bacterium]
MIFSIIFGYRMQQNRNFDLRNVFFSIFTILFITSFALVPAIWNRTLKVLLPIKSEFVRLISKDINVAKTILSNGTKTTVTKYFLTFEFSNGCRKTFCVNPSSSRYDIFFSVLQDESGMLCYKEQGKHLYFVSFTPDSTG